MNPKNLDGIHQLAGRYADELSAQFRTLSLFAQHAGEVGRTHEVFLRQVLTRFLPGQLRCGTGFVASEEAVTRQQDIIIYDPYSFPLLLEIGDCLVVDEAAVAGIVEVKTVLDSRPAFEAELEKLAHTSTQSRRRVALGIYIWEGLSLESALDCFWERFRSTPRVDMMHVPDFVYVRGSYILLPNYDGRIETAPLVSIRLGNSPESHDEGVGLLTLVARLWIAALQLRATRPWWVGTWDASVREKYHHCPWPPDLQRRVQEHLDKNPNRNPGDATWNRDIWKY